MPRARQLLGSVLLIVASLSAGGGCRQLTRALFYGAVDQAFATQYHGRGEGRLSSRETRQARLEEGGIRFALGPESYGHDGPVPPASLHVWP
jgi:hypothetical protein